MEVVDFNISPQEDNYEKNPNRNDFSNRIFIGKIPQEVTESMITEHFKNYGTIDNTHLPLKGDSHSGFGFVSFSSKNEMYSCLSSSPHTINGLELVVRQALPPSKLRGPGTAQFVDREFQNTRIFIGQMPPETTESDLKKYFINFGEIYIPKQKPKTNKNYAFLTFQDTNGFYKCLSQPSHFLDNGQELHVIEADPKPIKSPRAPPPYRDHYDSHYEKNYEYYQSPKRNSLKHSATPKNNTRIFIGQLSAENTKGELQNHFEQFGYIKEIYIPKQSDSHKAKNYAFLTYSDSSGFYKCLAHGEHVLEKTGQKLHVIEADPKPERLSYSHSSHPHKYPPHPESPYFSEPPYYPYSYHGPPPYPGPSPHQGPPINMSPYYSNPNVYHRSSYNSPHNTSQYAPVFRPKNNKKYHPYNQ